MFITLVITISLLIAIHVGSFGLYAMREEKNIRGAVGAFITAGLTFLAPIFMIWYTSTLNR